MKHNKGIGHFQNALYLCCVLSLFLFPSPGTCSTTESGYQAELIRLSKERNLSSDRYWAVLLHYQQGWMGYRSLIDDPNFFLSPEGKNNPAAELDATIQSFFQEERPNEEHPRCKFIARYNWLKERLGIDETMLPPVSCQKYRETAGKIKPESATLIFPSAYLNNPSSMFGHTFIKINVGYENQKFIFTNMWIFQVPPLISISKKQFSVIK